MAEQAVNYQCPACTGPLRFDGKTGKLKCDYCGSTFTTQEVEKLYAEKNAAAAKAGKEAQKKEEEQKKEAARAAAAAGGAAAPGGKAPVTKGTAGADEDAGSEWGSDAAKMRAYNCTSCGAELICDETTAATQCPYCGNNTIIPGRFAGTAKPDYVIPFKYEKKDAVDALKNYYKGKLLLPGSFSNANHLEEIKGVYVPFWLYSGHVDASGLYDAKQDEVFRQGEFQVTRTKHFEASREGTISFSRIPVDASSKMPDDLMDSIEPFDYKAITDFSLAYMPGYLANKYDVSKKDCGKRAEERARNSAKDALQATVTGYTSVTARTHDEKITNEKTEYAVFPVWLLSTKWLDKSFLFAMNGQTGRMIGNLPVSRAKQVIWFLAVFVVSLLIFGGFLLTGDDVTASSYLIAIAFAFIPAVIVNFVLIGQMRPVAQVHQASAYVTQGGMQLRVKNDRYLRTTESRVKIQNAQPKAVGATPPPAAPGAMGEPGRPDGHGHGPGPGGGRHH